MIPLFDSKLPCDFTLSVPSQFPNNTLIMFNRKRNEQVCWFTRNPTNDGGYEPHHIIFDDNCHNDPEDSIVTVRARRSTRDAFGPLTGEEVRQYHGVLTVKARHL